MCYSRRMDRIPLRELRNHASQVVRRARAGERLLITVDGIPAAEIGPAPVAGRVTTLEELIARGEVIAPSQPTPADPARPVRVRSPRSSLEVLRELRAR